MDEKILIKLLQIQFSHNRKLNEFIGKMNLGYLEIDLLSLVLDSIGVPADNTLAQIRKHGYGNWYEQSDTFTRDWHYREFQRVVVQGTAEECRSYLEAVRQSNLLSYQVNTQAANFAFVNN